MKRFKLPPDVPLTEAFPACDEKLAGRPSAAQLACLTAGLGPSIRLLASHGSDVNELPSSTGLNSSPTLGALTVDCDLALNVRSSMIFQVIPYPSVESDPASE